MKKLTIITLIIISSGIRLFAQPLPPFVHGSTTNQGGAPLDGGLSILLIVGAAFGTKKVYCLKKKTVKGE